MTYDEFLEEYDEMTYRFKGVSMNPLLKEGRDLFTVRRKKPDERLKRYDVALYHRGKDYVLHRVIKVLPDGHYVILGDNCINKEYQTTDDDIIGIMTSFIRKGHVYTVEDARYKLYVRVHMLLTPLRILYQRAKGWLYRRLHHKR